MPQRPAKACRKSGCKNLVRTNEFNGYCEDHKTECGWHANEKAKGNRHKRGYDNNWQLVIVPEVKALAKGLCQNCLPKGIVKSAGGKGQGVVEHIIPKALGGSNSYKNLSLFCKACATEKTQAETRMTRIEIWQKWGHTAVLRA